MLLVLSCYRLDGRHGDRLRKSREANRALPGSIVTGRATTFGNMTRQKMSVTDAGGEGTKPRQPSSLQERHRYVSDSPRCPGCVQTGIKWNYVWFLSLPLPLFRPVAPRRGDCCLLLIWWRGPLRRNPRLTRAQALPPPPRLSPRLASDNRTAGTKTHCQAHAGAPAPAAPRAGAHGAHQAGVCRLKELRPMAQQLATAAHAGGLCGSDRLRAQPHRRCRGGGISGAGPRVPARQALCRSGNGSGSGRRDDGELADYADFLDAEASHDGR